MAFSFLRFNIELEFVRVSRDGRAEDYNPHGRARLPGYKPAPINTAAFPPEIENVYVYIYIY